MAGWLLRYQRPWLRWDVLAGLTTAAAVVIPQAVAYASLAGLPVQVGLYVALAPMLVYALASLLADLAEAVLGAIVLVAAIGLVNLAPLRRIRRGAELLGRTSLESGSGPLGVRFFPSLDQAVLAYERRAEPNRPPV